MSTSKTASFHVALRTSHVVDNAQYAVTLHDFERWGLSRPSFKKSVRGVHGLPETVTVLDKAGHIQLTERIQMQWYAWLCDLDRGRSETEYQRDFMSLTASDRAFTNRYGSTANGGAAYARACYPTRTNLDQEDMRFPFPLLCGGTYLKILSDPNAPVLEYETLSSTEDLTGYSPATHPHLFFCPTNSVRTEIWWNKQTHEIVPEGTPGAVWSGSWIENKVTPFPQFRGRAIMPIMTRGAKVQRIERIKVRLLPKGSPIPSPFVE